jgi:hypothetical protein
MGIQLIAHPLPRAADEPAYDALFFIVKSCIWIIMSYPLNICQELTRVFPIILFNADRRTKLIDKTINVYDTMCEECSLRI